MQGGNRSAKIPFSTLSKSKEELGGSWEINKVLTVYSYARMNFFPYPATPARTLKGSPMRDLASSLKVLYPLNKLAVVSKKMSGKL